MGSQGGRTHSKAAAGRLVGPHLHADKLGGTGGEQDRPHDPEFQAREKKASKPPVVKICGDCSGVRNS